MDVGCNMRAHFFFGLGLEDFDVPTFWPVLWGSVASAITATVDILADPNDMDPGLTVLVWP